MEQDGRSLAELLQRGTEVPDHAVEAGLDDRRVGIAGANLEAIGREGGQHRVAEIDERELHGPEHQVDVAAPTGMRVGLAAGASTTAPNGSKEPRRAHRACLCKPAHPGPLLERALTVGGATRWQGHLLHSLGTAVSTATFRGTVALCARESKPRFAPVQADAMFEALEDPLKER